MKKIFALISVAMLSSLQLWAQDVIVRTDDSSIEAKVVEITPETVAYRRADNPDGPLYRIPTAQVLLIMYSNGTVDRFGDASIASQPSGEINNQAIASQAGVGANNQTSIASQSSEGAYPQGSGQMDAAAQQRANEEAAKQQAYEDAVNATTATIIANEDAKALRQAQQEYYQRMAEAVYAVPDVRYRDIKGAFNPKDYVSQPWDPYQPVAAGFLSWIIPGLGQFTIGEPGKGAFYLVSSLVCTIGWMSCFTIAPVIAMAEPVGYNDYDYDEFAREQQDIFDTCLGLGFAFLAAAITVDISSICNAVKASKVKNMYVQDYIANRMDLGMEVKLSPSFSYVPSSNGLVPSAGLALQVNF